MTKVRPEHDRILQLTNDLFKQQLAWRRHLHQYPEVSNHEFQTTKFLTNEIQRLGLRILPLQLETGVLVELGGRNNSPTVAVRTDIDALPITEQTDIPFKSKNVGCMHACGHDVHMATVLGVATVLSKVQDGLPGKVRFIFQPAEEVPPGGARPMIENGALKNVSMIFGLHVDPHLPAGRIGLRDGPTMAAVIDFDLEILGKGGHAARPHTAVDALVIGSEVIQSIQKVVSRETDPMTPVAVTFGTITGGTARNVIADRLVIQGTARALSSEIARTLPKLVKKVAEGVCRAHGARAKLTIVAEYPVLSNDKQVNRIIERSYKTLYPKGHVAQSPAGLGGEDFACYLEHVPGAMFRLGVGNKKIGADKPWHSSHFKVDESALSVGTAVLALSVVDALHSLE